MLVKKKRAKTLKELIDQLRTEIETTNYDFENEKITNLIEMIIKKPDELCKTKEFFELPLTVIFNIAPQIGFSLACEPKIAIQNFVEKTLLAHPNETDNFMILKHLNIENLEMTPFDYIEIIQLFKDSEIFAGFCKSFTNYESQDRNNFKYEYEETQNKIDSLQEELNERQMEKIESPNYEHTRGVSYIIKPCINNKLNELAASIERYGASIDARVTKTDVKYELYEGDTGLHIAVIKNYTKILRYLVENAKADINMKGYQERTPLHCAVQKGNELIVRYLVMHGADVNATNIYGETPLLWASRLGHYQIVKYLLEHDADVKIESQDQKTPLNSVCEFYFNENKPRISKKIHELLMSTIIYIHV